MARFKKMTPQQRDLYAALRALRACFLTLADSRPARALKRRGLVRFERRNGARYVVLKQTTAERAEKARLRRWNKGDFWPTKITKTLAPSRLAGRLPTRHAARKKITT